MKAPLYCLLFPFLVFSQLAYGQFIPLEQMKFPSAPIAWEIADSGKVILCFLPGEALNQNRKSCEIVESDARTLQVLRRTKTNRLGSPLGNKLLGVCRQRDAMTIGLSAGKKVQWWRLRRDDLSLELIATLSVKSSEEILGGVPDSSGVLVLSRKSDGWVVYEADPAGNISSRFFPYEDRRDLAPQVLFKRHTRFAAPSDPLPYNAQELIRQVHLFAGRGNLWITVDNTGEGKPASPASTTVIRLDLAKAAWSVQSAPYGDPSWTGAYTTHLNMQEYLWDGIKRDILLAYWGGMLDMGATTFWEDFNVDWMENTARLDEFTPEGKNNIHCSFGAYRYPSYRHSLCHGWSSGVTAWLTEYVLGIKVMEPGCKKLKIEPHLGTLDWVEGTFPKPLGVVRVKHTRLKYGEIETSVEAPEGIKLL